MKRPVEINLNKVQKEDELQNHSKLEKKLNKSNKKIISKIEEDQKAKLINNPHIKIKIVSMRNVEHKVTSNLLIYKRIDHDSIGLNQGRAKYYIDFNYKDLIRAILSTNNFSYMWSFMDPSITITPYSWTSCNL